MSRIIHLCVDIRGFLRSNRYPRDYRCFLDKDGNKMTPAAAREFLFDQLSKGHRVIPTTNCEGFDPQTGCPGHAAEGEENR